MKMKARKREREREREREKEREIKRERIVCERETIYISYQTFSLATTSIVARTRHLKRICKVRVLSGNTDYDGHLMMIQKNK